jgi:hypothetical protein
MEYVFIHAGHALSHICCHTEYVTFYALYARVEVAMSPTERLHNMLQAFSSVLSLTFEELELDRFSLEYLWEVLSIMGEGLL